MVRLEEPKKTFCIAAPVFYVLVVVSIFCIESKIIEHDSLDFIYVAYLKILCILWIMYSCIIIMFDFSIFGPRVKEEDNCKKMSMASMWRRILVFINMVLLAILMGYINYKIISYSSMNEELLNFQRVLLVLWSSCASLVIVSRIR